MELNRAIELTTLNWRAHWLKGVAYRKIDNLNGAHGAFQRAYEIQRNDARVASEYSASCSDLGLAKEAEAAALDAIRLSPENADVLANLSLALLISSKNPEALMAIKKAVLIDPTDCIFALLSVVIEDVIAGRRPQPHLLMDLRRDWKTSWLQNLYRPDLSLLD